MTEASAVTKYDPKELKAAEDNVALVWGVNNCPQGVRTQIARLTMAYQLDPFLKHFEILGGRVYVTHAGLLHYAMNIKECLRSIKVRPLNKDERESLMDEMKKGEIWRHASIELEMGKFGLVVFEGMAKAGGPGETNPIANGYHGFTMAEKRAVNRTLRLALSIAVPSAEEMGAEQFDLPMGDAVPQATIPKSGKESRIEAKLRKLDPPAETIETTATTSDAPPAEEPAPPINEEPPPDDSERQAVLDRLFDGIASLNQAKQMIFHRKVLGGRDISSLTIEDALSAQLVLDSPAYGGVAK